MTRHEPPRLRLVGSAPPSGGPGPSAPDDGAAWPYPADGQFSFTSWFEASRRLCGNDALLPQRGRRAAVVAPGACFHIAQAYSALREDLGWGPTDTYHPSEHRLDRGYDHVVVLDPPTGSPDLLPTLDEIRWSGVRHLTLTSSSRSRIARDAAASVVLPRMAADDVRFGLTALAALRASLGDEPRRYLPDAEPLWKSAVDIADRIAHARRVTVLARGWALGLAHALTAVLRDDLEIDAEAQPAREYHQRMHRTRRPPGLVWVLGDVADELIDSMRQSGAPVAHHPLDPAVQLAIVHTIAGATKH
ncbi:hypothetical protein [Arthrobacter sp. NEB 688]|uniref:hypothetical protein n=1 Tax=Arthrobacter sp. NEB 688 TaxID=904039 RepID=UPI0015663E10|nr:hypothetical protein [Arthrobacter sp. NEB 688]QKE85099.1 hypothetical protein HL663_14925 [Arthrobacter sp. NEB 688]